MATRKNTGKELVDAIIALRSAIGEKDWINGQEASEMGYSSVKEYAKALKEHPDTTREKLQKAVDLHKFERVYVRDGKANGWWYRAKA